jgi:raffinose/stachyose/melibiose transport system permease protein
VQINKSGRVAMTAMASPAIALYLAFIVIPLVLAVYLSFTNWNGFAPHPGFVGTQNYTRALRDQEVIHASEVTAIIAGAGTLLCNVLGLGFALVLQKSTKINSVLRSILFYPYVVSPLIVGFLWAAILGTYGVVNSILTAHGHSVVPFLSSPKWALWSVVFVVVWATFGFNVVLYLAGLQTVPKDLLDAARVDGAGPVRLLRHVTLPLLAPIVTINVVLTLVGLIRTYELVLSLTGGEPAGTTRTIAFLILFESFQNNKLGFGSAQAVMLMVVTSILAIVVIMFRRRREADLGGGA